jgi:hypothetical protein
MGAEFVLWWISGALFPLFRSLPRKASSLEPSEGGTKIIGIECLIKHEPDT